MAIQDPDGGLAATSGGAFTSAPSPAGGIQLTVADNASITIPANSAGAKTEVDVTALKVNPSLASHVSLKVTDTAGNVTLCDPAITAISRDEAHPTIVRLRGIPKAEGKVHIYNGNPGLTHMTVLVNGHKFHERDLVANQQVTLDISSALTAGNNNSVIFIARGKQRGEATIVVADS